MGEKRSHVSLRKKICRQDEKSQGSFMGGEQVNRLALFAITAEGGPRK
jgi:hypothetical protein